MATSRGGKGVGGARRLDARGRLLFARPIYSCIYSCKPRVADTETAILKFTETMVFGVRRIVSGWPKVTFDGSVGVI